MKTARKEQQPYFSSVFANLGRRGPAFSSEFNDRNESIWGGFGRNDGLAVSCHQNRPLGVGFIGFSIISSDSGY